MEKDKVNFSKITKEPGVYIFRGARKKVLYVGRATSLQDRLRSYFSQRVVAERGKRIEDAVFQTKKIETIPCDNVFDAIILEANLIKKYDPIFNAKEKDNKSFSFVVVTDEEYPKIKSIRGRELAILNKKEFKYIFGPFPQASVLKEILNTIQKIFPYRTKCTPNSGKKCFDAQIGLCPGVCNGDISRKEYAQRIQDIRRVFEGKKKQLLKTLEKRMLEAADGDNFERADQIKRQIHALNHINDIKFIKKEFAEGHAGFRMEAYDVAHFAGEDSVGVMVVFEDGEVKRSDFRVFNIRKAKKRDDIGALRELLSRRLKHPEWKFPNLLVIDGGKTQLNTATKVVEEFGFQIPIVSVVKDQYHRPREIYGSKSYAKAKEDEILKANKEAHEFALRKHKRKRSKRIR